MTHASPQPQPKAARKSIPAPPERRAPAIALAVALLAIAVPAALAAAPAAAQAPAPALASGADPALGSLTVRFHGLKSRAGSVRLTLAGSPEAYAGKAPATAEAGVAVEGDVVEITFERLKPGAYAIKAFHDVNGDGKMNTNPFGIPTEPYAFSNDAEGMMGPPGWAAATFAVKAGANRQTIDID